MFNLFTIFSAALVLYAVYQLGSLAGIFSERSGVANIAIEGNMIVGAVLFALFYENINQVLGFGQIESVLISLLISVPLSAIFMLLLSTLIIRYLSDHIIAGTGLNILAPVIMIFAYNMISPTISGDLRAETILLDISNLRGHIEIDGRMNNELSYLTVAFVLLTIVILLISSFAINKTSFGLRLRSSGENPYALETSGISVNKTRIVALYIAGLLSSFAGVVFVSAGNNFYFTVNGSGFLAIGILILGQYKIMGTVIGSIILSTFIGTFNSLPAILGTKIPLFNDNIYLFKMIPFLMPIIGLIIFRKSYVPKAVGQNFKKDQR